jgi:hypothetical protein
MPESGLDSDAVRESHRVLRRVQQHLLNAHENLGAQRESLGLVDVYHHPTSALSNLNYVTPRKNTAWVPGDNVEQGLAHLRQIGRTPRFQYIEGLFPPPFAKQLRKLGLETEIETPIMVYKTDGISGVLPPPVKVPEMPDAVMVETVKDHRGVEAWWYVWRNAYYDVISLGAEPLYVGRDMAALKFGQQIDVLAYRFKLPVGVARISVQEQTAHIVGLALMKEVRNSSMTRLLLSVALQAAVGRGCNLIFAPGETEDDRRIARELGFVDFSSIVCYSAQIETGREKADDEILGQPVLNLK